MGTNQLIRSECTAPSIRCDGVDEMLRRITVPVFFFYPRRLDLKALTRSLTESLCDFPVFAGRLRVDRNGMSIECSDAGVALSVVERRERAEAFCALYPSPNTSSYNTSTLLAIN